MKKRAIGACLALMVLALSIGMVGTAAAAPLPGQAYQGSAYGTYATVGNTVRSGMSSPVVLPCAPQAPPGYFAHSTTAALNAAPLLTTGVIDNSVSTGPSTGPLLSTSKSNITNASLLSGLVSASAIKAVSATSFDSTGYHVSGAGSSLVGLSVAGLPIVGTPAPNTTLPLPGVGNVVLNEQTQKITATNAYLTVNMIDITVTTNTLPGVPAGTRIIVGHAVSGLTRQAVNAPTLRGFASGAYAHVGSLITAGQEFPVSFCGSTNGRTITNSALSTNISGVLSTGTVANTVNGTIGTTTSRSKSTATVQNLNLLSGLVKVDAIKAEANASITGGTVRLDENGTTFTNLVVNGQTLVHPAANTKITIGGITVWLNRVIKTSNGITVRMIEITVSGSNPYGLPVKSDIQVASAFAAAYPHPAS